PPLRARRDDIGLLAEHFLQAIGRQEGVARRASAATLAQWRAYDWPGNVRELRNIVHRAYVMAAGSEIVDACIPSVDDARLVEARPAPASATMWVQIGTRWEEIERQVTLATLEHFDGHHQRTCEALGISVKTLYNWLRDWSLVTGRRQRMLQAASQARGTAATP